MKQINLDAQKINSMNVISIIKSEIKQLKKTDILVIEHYIKYHWFSLNHLICVAYMMLWQ